VDKKNLMPQQAQPVNRIATGQLPTELTELAELSEEALTDSSAVSSSVLPQWFEDCYRCSYDGDDAE
jgi:bacteriocin leader peptide (microcyclamide/patellamide family)